MCEPDAILEAVRGMRVAEPAMALSKLSGDEQCIIFSKLCNALDPSVAVAFSSANSELRALTQALLQQLRADHDVATTLSRKMGMRSCKVLRQAYHISCDFGRLSAADLAMLGTLGAAMPALGVLWFKKSKKSSGGGGHVDGVRLLAEGLGAGALPSVTELSVCNGAHVGGAGASALAAALGRGALLRLKRLELSSAAIGDAGVVALGPALQRLPALEVLDLGNSQLGDEGLAALVAPPPLPAGAPPPPKGVLTKLQTLGLDGTRITDAGCAALAAAFDSGALPELKSLYLMGSQAGAAAQAAVHTVMNKRENAVSGKY